MEYMSELLHILAFLLALQSRQQLLTRSEGGHLFFVKVFAAILVGIGGALEYIKYGGHTDIGSWGPLAAIGSWGPLTTSA